MAWSNLSKVEPRFVRFLKLLCKIYVNVPFLEALKEALFYFKFSKELFSKKGKLEEVTAVPMGEGRSAILRSKSPSKL